MNDYNQSKFDMDINGTASYETNNIRDSLLTTYVEHRSTTRNSTVNLYYDLKLDTLGKSFQFLEITSPMF